jgi:predicted nucleic acid-binding Zn ribbon protein
MKEIGKCEICGAPIMETEQCCGEDSRIIYNCSCIEKEFTNEKTNSI